MSRCSRAGRSVPAVPLLVGMAVALLLVGAVGPADRWGQQPADAEGAAAVSAALSEPVEGGLVDWADLVVRAAGRGLRPRGALSIAQAKLLARRAAVLDAQRNLIRALGSVRCDADRTLAAATSAELIRGLVFGARVVAETANPDGSCEVTLEAPLSGVRGIVRTGGSSPVATEASDRSQRPAVTGLIVDARGLGLKPALLPRLVTPRGRTLYGPEFAAAYGAGQAGPVAYVTDMADAWAHPRAGADPIVVRAVAARGRASCDAELADIDARAVACLSQEGGFLAVGAVVLVIDPLNG